ncbi:MAG TPA: LPS assembly lipoprotein LptE [Lysobacter sp.]|nr:LPS assembly lipoprotein LptE [Lysobacter sp.]
MNIPSKHRIRILLVLSATLALAACGFHLRKGVSLPADLGPLRVVSGNRYSQLAEALSQTLERSGAVPAPDPVEVVPQPGDAEGTVPPADAIAPAAPTLAPVATLNIRKERWGSLPVAIDARGRATELTLRYAVEFDLLRADGSVLVPRQVVELARNYITVPTQSIGTDSEQEILAKEMRRDMVASIMRRIDAALQSTDPTGETPALPAEDAVPPPTP